MIGFFDRDLFFFYLRMTNIFGKRCMVKLLVHFRRVLHLEQVGISSPSRISSLIKWSKQSDNLHRVLDGNGKLKSQKGSKFTLVFSHTVHFKVLLSWPANKSLITEFSVFEYQFHINSAFLLSLKRKSSFLNRLILILWDPGSLAGSQQPEFLEKWSFLA